MRRSFALALCLTLALPLSARPAHAEAAPRIADVEAAYAEVDFERTRSLAREVLSRGKSEPRETLALYTLLGISAAALGEDDTARGAFRVAVALDPNARIDKNLSPKIRGPYLEARGSLGTRGELRALEAELWRDEKKRVRFTLHDPANVVQRAELAYMDGFNTWQQVKLPLEREGIVPGNPAKATLEYALVLRDEFGNVLFRRGSETTPATLAAAGATASTTRRSSDPFSPPVAGERVNQTPTMSLPARSQRAVSRPRASARTSTSSAKSSRANGTAPVASAAERLESRNAPTWTNGEHVPKRSGSACTRPVVRCSWAAR
jgi:hypothetical protein